MSVNFPEWAVPHIDARRKPRVHSWEESNATDSLAVVGTDSALARLNEL
jgi:hypothetical protein